MSSWKAKTPTQGKDFILYLDARLQQYAYDLLGDYTGSVVAIDPTTGGGTRRLFFQACYDPNLFVVVISVKNTHSFVNLKNSHFSIVLYVGGYPPAFY